MQPDTVCLQGSRMAATSHEIGLYTFAPHALSNNLIFIAPHWDNKQCWMYWSPHCLEVLSHLQFIVMSNCCVLLSVVSPWGFWTLMDSLSACLHILSLVLQSFNLCINPLWLHSPESYCITSVSTPLLTSPPVTVKQTTGGAALSINSRCCSLMPYRLNW